MAVSLYTKVVKNYARTSGMTNSDFLCWQVKIPVGRNHTGVTETEASSSNHVGVGTTEHPVAWLVPWGRGVIFISPAVRWLSCGKHIQVATTAVFTNENRMFSALNRTRQRTCSFTFSLRHIVTHRHDRKLNMDGLCFCCWLHVEVKTSLLMF